MADSRFSMASKWADEASTSKLSAVADSTQDRKGKRKAAAPVEQELSDDNAGDASDDGGSDSGSIESVHFFEPSEDEEESDGGDMGIGGERIGSGSTSDEDESEDEKIVQPLTEKELRKHAAAAVSPFFSPRSLLTDNLPRRRRLGSSTSLESHQV